MISPSRFIMTICSGRISSYRTPEGLMTMSPVSVSRALTFPPVHTTRLCFGNSRCSWTNSSLNFSSISLPRFLIVNLLLQPIHGGSFDDKSLFVAFHEHRKAIDILLIGHDRRAIFPRKDLIGEIDFQRFIRCLMEHIGCKQCNSPCTALACGLHHGNGNIHCRCHNLLTHFLCFEEATVTKDLVDLYLLLFKEDVQSNLQCTKRREQMHAHEVRKCETAFGCTDEKWTTLLKVRNVLARKIIVGKKPAAIRITRERLLIQRFI